MLYSEKFYDILTYKYSLIDQVKEKEPLFIVNSIVNAQERKALKRALESKENWKDNAQERKKRIRLLEDG